MVTISLNEIAWGLESQIRRINVPHRVTQNMEYLVAAFYNEINSKRSASDAGIDDIKKALEHFLNKGKETITLPNK